MFPDTGPVAGAVRAGGAGGEGAAPGSCRYTGFPALGIEWQKLESPAMQRALGMKTGQKGVLIRWA